MPRSKSILAILALSLVLTALAGAQAQPAYKDGVYTLDYQDGELGNVTVAVTVKGGHLVAVAFPKGLGDVQMEQKDVDAWLKTFLAAPDYLTVDVVSGASQSCNLIRYAVQNALKQATK